MKYNVTARVYGDMFAWMLKSYYKKHFPETDFSEIREEIKKEYRTMVERTPGVGGNSLEMDLIAACFFFSMGKVVPDMTPELMNDIVEECIQSDFLQKAHEGKRKKGTLFSDKVQNQRVLEAKKSQSSPYEMDWKYTYEKGKDEFYCTYTECGICKLAKREHAERFLPCMCHMDYSTYAMVGAKLIRTKTLANGDDCCNFHVIRDYPSLK